jgi:hypothetical protein
MAGMAFPDLYAAVGKLVQQKADPGSIDAFIQAQGGMDVPTYKQQVAQFKASQGQVPADVKSSPLGDTALNAGLRGAADTMSFGTLDEIGALMDAGVQHLSGKGEFSDLYGKRLNEIRTGQAAMAAKHPTATMVGRVAGGLLEAPVLPGPGAAATLGGAAVRGAAAGAASGAAYGLGSGEGGPGEARPFTDRLPSMVEAGIEGGAFGGALGTLGHLAGQGIQALRGAKNIPVAGIGGGLTDEAHGALTRAGIDANRLDPATVQEMASRLRGRQSKPDDVVATYRTLLGERHGVPVTRGQALGDADEATMQRMLSGTEGPGAQRVIEGFKQGQDAAVGQAAENIAQAAAPGGRGGYGESGTGHLVAQHVNDAADQAWQEVGNAYKQAGADRVVIPAPATADLIPRIFGDQGALARSNYAAVRPERAPATASIRDTLEHYVVGQDPTLAHVDDVRKTLGEMARDPSISDTDRRMVRIALGEFDKWTDDAIGSQASTLPAQSLQQLKQARGTARDWFRTFQKDPLNKDNVGPVIEDIRNGTLTGNKLFDRLMGAKTAFDDSALPVARRVRAITGDQSPAWQTLQQGMIRRIVFGDANKQSMDPQPGQQAWQTMKTRIGQALNGRGEALARDMLGDETTNRLLDLRDLADSMTVKQKMQAQGSGYENIRSRQEMMNRLLKTVSSGVGAGTGFVLGGPVGAAVGGGLGMAGTLALERVGQRQAADAARQLTRGYAPPPMLRLPQLPAGIPTAAGAVTPGLLEPPDARYRRDLLGR